VCDDPGDAQELGDGMGAGRGAGHGSGRADDTGRGSDGAVRGSDNGGQWRMIARLWEISVVGGMFLVVLTLEVILAARCGDEIMEGIE